MSLRTIFNKQLATASANNIALSQSSAAGVAMTLNGAAVTAGVAKIDTATAANTAIGRRVAIAYTGTDTSFAIIGTNSTDNPISDVAVGGSGAAQSNLDFVTVTKITQVGGTALTGVTAGTNGVGSSPWTVFNWRGYAPMSIGIAVELVAASVNFTVEYTYDDPNNLEAGVVFPLPFALAAITSKSATIDSVLPPAGGAITAARVTVNSGTGEIRTRFVQAGAG